MPRPSFSEMLVTRRRQLGLSISQASQVLRLKEQVLIAFEEGDFDRIPKSGYAQGMLSSYARYLGLNPRQVVSEFQGDLSDYLSRSGGYGAESSSTQALGSVSPIVESRGLLPTSGGPAGDLGAFATTSQPHSRQQSSPLVGQRRHVGSLHDQQARPYGYDGEDVPPARQASGADQPRSAQARTRPRRTPAERARGSAYARDDITMRRAVARYADDTGYSEETVPYEPAATRARRRSGGSPGSQRTRQASPSRPQRVPGRSGGVVGSVIDFLSDRTRLIVTAAVAGVLILVLALSFAMRSCTSDKGEDSGKTVPVSQSDATSPTDATSTGATATGGATPSGTDATTATTGSQTTTPEETVVVVSVDSGAVSWVEILCDGESKVATTLTGPWSETYTVHDSITIEVGDTTAVSVTKNGKVCQFDSKTSGIGTLTIQGTPAATTPTTSTTGAAPTSSTAAPGGTTPDAGAANGATTQDTGGSDPTDAQDTDGSDSADAQDTGEDEYLYDYNGYSIYYSAEGDYYYFFDENGNKLNAQDGTPIG